MMNKILLFISLMFVSCEIPHDAGQSWQSAQIEGLRVGVIDNPPYATTEQDDFTGKEVDIIRDFAEKKGIGISFHTEHESALFKKLEHHQLHIVIGGIEKKTIWKKKIAPSYAYDSEHVFAVPKGENRLLYELENHLIKIRNHEEAKSK